MKAKIILGSLLAALSSTAQASIFNNKKFDTHISYACLSIDGVPISNSTDQASRCCDGGGNLKSDPPDECKIGFASMIPESGKVGYGLMVMAQNEIKQASDAVGVQRDQTDPKTPDYSADTQASDGTMSAMGASASGGMGKDAMLAGLSGKSGSSGGSGRGASDSNAANGGFGSVTGAGARGKTGDSSSASGDSQGSGAGYASKGGAEGNRAEGDGGKVGAGDLSELNFNDGSSGALNASKGDDELTGSKEDSPDYLNRIDKAASIFKIVSKRYQKEIARNRVRRVEIK
jgi:hypothetical protein